MCIEIRCFIKGDARRVVCEGHFLTLYRPSSLLQTLKSLCVSTLLLPFPSLFVSSSVKGDFFFFFWWPGVFTFLIGCRKPMGSSMSVHSNSCDMNMLYQKVTAPWNMRNSCTQINKQATINNSISIFHSTDWFLLLSYWIKLLECFHASNKKINVV